jgi:hypothetical protein
MSSLNSCTRKDSLPEIESLQRAICIAYKMTKIWCDRWHVAKDYQLSSDDEKFAFGMYMHSECIENYLKEHCGHLGLEYTWHKVGKPCSIAGEAFLDKIWDSNANNWRKEEKTNDE